MISEKMETKQKAFMISASWNSFDLGKPVSGFLPINRIFIIQEHLNKTL